MTHQTNAPSTTKLKALLYCRISSESQARKGDGLRSQETRCREYVRYKGNEVERVFYDRAISGKLVDRPGIRELLQFLQRSKDPESYVVVFDDISRLARDIRAYLDLRDAIFDTGAQMDCPNTEFREDSDGKYFEGMQALNAQHFRLKNAETTKNRMRARVMNGYWVFQKPPGYIYVEERGNGRVLARNEPVASIIQEALSGFASGRFETQAEVKRFLESQDQYPNRDKRGDVRFEDVMRLLTRPIYAGYVEYAKWGIGLRKGHHPALITLEEFQRIQERIAQAARAPARKDINMEFPLRGFIACTCTKPLTGAFSTSKTGKKHAYYSCHNKDCDSFRKSIKRSDIEDAFETMLGQLEPSKRLVSYLTIIFKREWELCLARAGEMKKAMRRDMLRIDKDIEKLMDRLVDAQSNTAVTAYERRIAKLEKDKLLKAEKLKNDFGPKRPFDEMFELALNFLANPGKLWASERIEDKRTVLKLTFEERLVYCRNQGLRTPKTTLPFNILGDINRGVCKMAERQAAQLECKQMCVRTNKQLNQYNKTNWLCKGVL